MRGLGAVLLCGAVAVLVACSDPPAEPDAEPAPTISSEASPFRVAEMLAEMPAGVRGPDQAFTLYTGDLTLATELSGLARPGDAESQQVGEWVSQLGGTGEAGPYPAFVPLVVPLAASSPANLVEEDLGWSVVDVERFINYSIAVNASTMIAAGAFDDDTLAALPEVGTGIRTAGEGDDLDDILADATPARPHGVPLRMAVDDGRLVASTYTPIVQDWLAGTEESLADDPLLAQLAAVLDEKHVYSAVVATPTRLEQSRIPSFVLEGLGLVPDDFPRFDIYAIGWGVERDGPAITVVYHASAGASVQDLRAKVAARWHGTSYRGDEVSTLVDVGPIKVVGENVVVSMAPAGLRGAETVFLMAELDELPFVTR